MPVSRRVDVEPVFGLVDREIWIVTAAADQERGGLVATWVSEASIDREHPAVAIGIAPNHFTSELIDGSRAFAVHLITEAEVDLALNFAIGSGRDRDKLADLTVRAEETGSPILSSCLAWLDCRVFHEERTGDRIYYWADVVAASAKSDGVPLTESKLMELASDDQKKSLRAGRDHDIQIQRLLQQEWRSRIAAE